MKKLLLFIFVVAAAYTAQAQSTFGIRGGANLSNLSGDLRDESQFNNKAGFHAGITMNFGIISDFLSIQPEVLYSNKGFKLADEEYTDILLGNVRRTGKVNYNYLDVPVLAKIKAGPLYFEAGPQASYLINVNNKSQTFINGQERSSTTSERSTDDLNKFELGYAAGLGLGANGMSIGVRYSGSFSDFASDAPSDYFGGELKNARHSVFMLTLGFTLPSR
ncbi:porin family protein [Pontibacter sp. SGAir0037]|uniref:porin family protein n=1 Tax=Pontibacter sp. SGAir0037 TaxID=2571030 RepID=UPI0010CCDAE5|nr:porin family protein [Pontibacter sp. SGAir0037]QCR25184.1 PorT family protein [Pontibacter sp. SGAir0037]